MGLVQNMAIQSDIVAVAVADLLADVLPAFEPSQKMEAVFKTSTVASSPEWSEKQHSFMRKLRAFSR